MRICLRLIDKETIFEDEGVDQNTALQHVLTQLELLFDTATWQDCPGLDSCLAVINSELLSYLIENNER